MPANGSRHIPGNRWRPAGISGQHQGREFPPLVFVTRLYLWTTSNVSGHETFSDRPCVGTVSDPRRGKAEKRCVQSCDFTFAGSGPADVPHGAGLSPQAVSSQARCDIFYKVIIYYCTLPDSFGSRRTFQVFCRVCIVSCRPAPSRNGVCVKSYIVAFYK